MMFVTMACEVQDRSWGDASSQGGILITILGQPNEEKASRPMACAPTVRMLCQSNGAQLAEIGSLIEAGRVTAGADHLPARAYRRGPRTPRTPAPIATRSMITVRD